MESKQLVLETSQPNGEVWGTDHHTVEHADSSGKDAMRNHGATGYQIVIPHQIKDEVLKVVGVING
jgi:guanylate kinase